MNELLEFDDLVDNPIPRVPVSLCLDCSGSMSGAPIDELNKGVKAFYSAIYKDEVARYSAEISIVTFGPVKLETDFQTLDVNSQAPILRASGQTPMGSAIKLSLDSLESRKEQYRKNGVDYYQPWLVLMTDGRPCGEPAGVLEEQTRRVAKMVESRKLTVFPIAIGNDVPMQVLQQLSPNRSPLRLKGLNFSEFFAWLSKSVSKVSQSAPGDKIDLDLDGLKGWAQL